MSFAKTVKKIPFLGNLAVKGVNYFRLVLRLKQLNPKSVIIHNSLNCLYADRNEPRGLAVLYCKSSGQPFLKSFWTKAIDIYHPGIIIDVGANYGEVLFLPTYEKGVRVIGIEADTKLVKWLNKSHAAHANKNQIEVICALANDKEEGVTEFFVDKNWSGRSSALASDTGDFEKRQVKNLRSVNSLKTPI